MGDTKQFDFLDNSEIQVFSNAQPVLLLDAQDILFRAYDLLFTCYPVLREKLPADRYQHPDIVSLLYNTDELIAVGMNASQTLLVALSPGSERETINSVSLIKQCLLKALRDVLFDELSPLLLQAYSKVLEQRMIDLIKANSFADSYETSNQNFVSSVSKTCR